MRLFVTLSLAVLVLAFGGLFFVRDPAGRPVLTVQGLARQTMAAGRDARRGLEGVVARLGGVAGGDGAGSGAARGAGRGSGGAGGDRLLLYRWQDAEGVWHYSDQPDPSGRGSELVEIDPDRNVIDGMGAAARLPEAGSAAQPVAAPVMPELVVPGLPSPQNVRELMDEATAIEERLQERARDMEAATRPPGS